MRAAVYCRISRDKKVDGSHTMLGVERQQEDCQTLVATLGWEVAEVFVDNDISATSGRVRPAYKRMLKAIEARDIDAIVCWHPDRLYRRTTDLEELVAVCDRHRVPIATVNAGAVDLTTPTGRLVAGLLAQVAKYEGEHKAERWKRSYRQKREAGLPTGIGPRLFGYTRDGEVVAEEADAIRHVAAMVLNGGTMRAGCRYLNELGLTTTLGNKWQVTALKLTLTNERLAGWVTYKGERVCRSGWEPVLDDDTMAAIQGRLRVNGHRPRSPRVSSLVGLMYCAVCGARMTTARRDSGARAYKCPPTNDGGHGCVSIGAEPVEAIVEAYAQERLADPRVRQELARSRTEDGGAKAAHEVSVLEARLLALNDELAEDTGRPVPELLRAIEKVRERIEEAQSRLATLSGPVPQVGAKWPEDAEGRHALIRVVVDRVDVERVPREGVRGRFHPERVKITPR